MGCQRVRDRAKRRSRIHCRHDAVYVQSQRKLHAHPGFQSLAGLNASNTTQRFFSFNPTLALFASTSGSSEAFAEYAYFSHAGLGLPGKTLIDFGYEQDLGRHLQLDAEYGVSPTVINGQQQHYVGAGVSFMFGS